MTLIAEACIVDIVLLLKCARERVVVTPAKVTVEVEKPMNLSFSNALLVYM